MVSVQLENDFIRNGMYLRNWSKRTAHTYRAAFISLRKFQTSLPESSQEPDESGSLLTKARLESWVCWLRDTSVTPGGCNMYIRTVNSFLQWLYKEQLQDTSGLTIPVIQLLRCHPKCIQAFSDRDIKLIISFRPKGFYETRTWTLIQTLLDTGCRIDELLSLVTNNVDLESLILTVMGKGSKPRQVPISLENRKVLFRYLNSKTKTVIRTEPHFIKHVFSTRDGEKLMYRNVFRDVQRLCKKAGITRHVHPHLMRHCFAVTYIRRGGDIYRLSRILGHTSISTTQLYLRSMGIEQIGENHSSLSPLSRGV